MKRQHIGNVCPARRGHFSGNEKHQTVEGSYFRELVDSGKWVLDLCVECGSIFVVEGTAAKGAEAKHKTILTSDEPKAS